MDRLQIIENYKDKISSILLALINDMHETFKHFDVTVKKYDRQIEVLANQSDVCREIQKIPGVGPIVASAITATVGGTLRLVHPLYTSIAKFNQNLTNCMRAECGY